MESYLLSLSEKEFLDCFQRSTIESHLVSSFYEHYHSNHSFVSMPMGDSINCTYTEDDRFDRMSIVDEKNSLPSISFDSENTSFRFFMIIENHLAGYGVFKPYKLLFSFEHVLHPEERWQYPVSILHEQNRFLALSIEQANHLCSEGLQYSDGMAFLLNNFEHLIEMAEENEKKKKKKIRRNKEQGLINQKHTYSTHTYQKSNEFVSPHYKCQLQIKKIGEIIGLDNWVAKNDKNRIVHGERLGDHCLEHFPNFQLKEDEFTNRFDLVDNIWFKDDIPYSFFEIEYSSSIISGILRISDVLAAIPSSKPFLYIVAPRERKRDVFRELNRPTFKTLGISNMAYFIAMEDVEILYEKIKGLNGYIKPDIMQCIAQQI